MRIAYLSTDPGVPYGGRKGASVHVAELVDALAGEGADVLTLVSGVAVDAAPPAPGVVVEPLPVPGKGSSAAQRLAAEPQRTDWLEQRLARFRPDILYERLALHSAAGARAAARLGIPHFVELNAPLVDEASRYRGLDEPEAAVRLERAVLEGADLVLAVSSPLTHYARRRGARRVEVLPNAVAIERYPEPRPRRGRPVAVFTGRVRPWHGIETVVAAWRLLGDAAPPLVVAGEPGEARAALEEVGVSLLGPIPHRQVPAVLAEADIGLAPYARGAPGYFSPLKLYEYMAAGLAVVAGELPGTRELVPGEHGLLVPPGEPEALAAAVAALAVDPPGRARMGRAARDLVASRHTWRHRARQVMAQAGRRPEAATPLEALSPGAVRA
jgi:glycosyltransferase involved in cell wall biosynthesis